MNQHEKALDILLRQSLGFEFRGHNFVWKFHATEFDPPGIPDIIGSVHGIFVGLECKVSGGRFSEVQKAKLEQLEATGAIVGGVYHDVEADVYYYLTASDVQKFSLRNRGSWLRIVKYPAHLPSGTSITVLKLSFLRTLIIQALEDSLRTLTKEKKS